MPTPYAVVDWTIEDLPKSIVVPPFAVGEAIDDLRLQITINSAFQGYPDVSDKIGIMYNPITSTLNFFVSEENLDDEDTAMEAFHS